MRHAQVMVANIRCAELLEEQLRALAADSAWAALRDAAAAGLVPEFGSRVAALLDSCISGMSLIPSLPAIKAQSS